MIRAELVPPGPPGVPLPANAVEADLRGYLAAEPLSTEVLGDTTTMLWKLVEGERGIDPEVYVRAVLVGGTATLLECIPYVD